MVRGPSLWFATLFTAALLRALFSAAGCSADDSASGDGGDDGSPELGDAYEEGPDYCASFDGAGSPCSPISSAVCFPMCEAGGCSCSVGPHGTGVWRCQTDLTCMPTCPPEDSNCILEGGEFADTGPIPDSFVPPRVDAATDASETSETEEGGQEAESG